MTIEELLEQDTNITVTMGQALSIIFPNETLIFEISDGTFVTLYRTWDELGFDSSVHTSLEEALGEVGDDISDYDDFIDVYEYTDNLPDNLPDVFKKVLLL